MIPISCSLSVSPYYAGWYRSDVGDCYSHTDTGILIYLEGIDTVEDPSDVQGRWLIQPPDEDPWEEVFADAGHAIRFTEQMFDEWRR